MLSPGRFGHRLHWDHLTRDEDEAAQRVMAEVAVAFEELGKTKGFDFIVVAHPHLYAVDGQKTTSSFGPLSDALRTRGIAYSDLTSYFREATKKNGIETYFYPIDGHYTPAGQELIYGAGELNRAGMLMFFRLV